MSKLSPRRLSAEETALLTVYLIRCYETETGKPCSRCRLSRTSLRRLSIRTNLRESFITEWREVLADAWGWLSAEDGDFFCLVRRSVTKGWVRIGTKRIAPVLRKLRHADLSAFDDVRDAVEPEQPDEDEQDE